MTNPYYNPSGVPATRAQLSSSAMRTELNAIKAGFEKLAPTLTANAMLHVNAAGTQQVAHASITVSAAGAVAGITDLAYTGTLTGSTGVMNIGAGQIYKDSSGNVMIGGTNPATFGKFAVSGTNGTLAYSALSAGFGDLTYGGGPGNILRVGPKNYASGGIALMYTTAGSVRTEGARIDSAGLMGTGGTPSAALFSGFTARLQSINTAAPSGIAAYQFDGTKNPRVGMFADAAGGVVGWDVSYSTGITGYSWQVGGVQKMKLDVDGNLIQFAPTAPPLLAVANEAVINMTSDTNLRISARGSDGITRFVDLVLTP